MGLFRMFYPSRRFDSAYDIDYEALYLDGIRGVIFDIDNTLVTHGAKADERSKKLFNRLSDIGFKCVLLSNNKEARVKSFADDVGFGVSYIYKANKPMKNGYMRAMDIMGTDIRTTLFVGDQLFTDVFGAKRLGMLCYLTKPIDPHEEIQIVLKRYLEAVVLHFYDKEHSGL